MAAQRFTIFYKTKIKKFFQLLALIFLCVSHGITKNRPTRNFYVVFHTMSQQNTNPKSALCFIPCHNRICNRNFTLCFISCHNIICGPELLLCFTPCHNRLGHLNLCCVSYHVITAFATSNLMCFIPCHNKIC
jgi:hypothetical protein